MATVHFTTALERFVSGLESIEISGETAFEVICKIDRRFPGVRGYILEENGALLDHGHWGCKLHRSRDEGNTWHELQPPQYPEGAKLKEDQDATLKYLWAFASDPQGRIYIGTEPGGLFHSDDIVYRHALDIAGDTLAFGTTTGNLYLSEDRGESWVCLSQNLPMVHSVEFL